MSGCLNNAYYAYAEVWCSVYIFLIDFDSWYFLICLDKNSSNY